MVFEGFSAVARGQQPWKFCRRECPFFELLATRRSFWLLFSHADSNGWASLYEAFVVVLSPVRSRRDPQIKVISRRGRVAQHSGAGTMEATILQMPRKIEASKRARHRRGDAGARRIAQDGRYWRAANYLSVGQIYLYDNPLLREPLKLDHVKRSCRTLGHDAWSEFIYVHLNRVIKKNDLNMFTSPVRGTAVLRGGQHLSRRDYSEVYPISPRTKLG